jgi:hypothetical protein
MFQALNIAENANTHKEHAITEVLASNVPLGLSETSIYCEVDPSYMVSSPE